MSEPVLSSADRDGVRTLTLNRPERKNALNPSLWTALADALREAARDRDLRALVITGAGGAFCYGADISAADDKIDAFVDDLAGRLAAGPPFALAQSKALLNDGANATLREALANEARAQPGNFATADSAEAYAAFAEKRTPPFTGRWLLRRERNA